MNKIKHHFKQYALIPIDTNLLCILDRKKTQIKNTNKQIYVVPQNQIRPWRQQIVYYWRNDTNTQLNPVQSHKTKCFTLTIGVSLKSALFHSHSCTYTHCTLTLSLDLTLSYLSLFIGEMRVLAATNKKTNNSLLLQ